MERTGNLLACPNCLSAEHIGENVTGWREIGAVRMVDGGLRIDRPYGRVEDAEHDSFFCSGPACNVDVEILAHKLVQLDHDGKPVTAQPPEQGQLV